MHSDRLLLREKSDASGDLLFKATASLMEGGTGVYEFSLRDKRFIYHKSEEIWNQADSPVEVLFTLGQGIVKNEKFGYGRHTLFKAENHGKDKLAVLTSSGFIIKTFSVFPAENAPEVILMGTTYFEIFDLRNPAAHSKPLRIKRSNFRTEIYWTQDDRFVIVAGYFNGGNVGFLGVVEVGETAT